MLQSLNQAYVVLHRSPDGQGSGYTIVSATSPAMARLMAWQYLSHKPFGYAQCSNSNLLEIESLEESSLFSDLYWSLPLQTRGIKCEYQLPPGESEESPIMVAYMPEEKSFLMFGVGGHEGKYVLNVAGHSTDEYIPQLLSKKLQSLLPDFSVDNHGSRIEIVGKPYGSRDDDKVKAAVKAVFGKNLNCSAL